MHPSPEDPHQEMLIVLTNESIERPQRRTTGFDTKVVIEGRASLHYYALDGKLSRTEKLGYPESLYVHTSTEEYHALKVETDFFVFLEILKGPFDSSTTEFASWHNQDGCDR
jgi:cupin fold WbuC family metalloprotein